MFFLSIIIFVIGFSSIFSQSILIRELLVVFCGNEISIGIILCSWLLWTGVGSFIFGKISSRIVNPLSILSFTYLLFSSIAITEIILIRNLRILLHLNPGQIVGPLPMFCTSLFVLAPFALVNGFLFSLSIKISSTKLGIKSVGFVYSLDAIGDMLGGILFSFLFVFLFSPLKNLYIIALLNLFFVFVAFFIYKIRLKQKLLGCIVFLALLILGFNIKYVDKFLLEKEWRGFNLIDTESSLYGHLYLTKYQDSFSLFENGILSFTFPSRMDSEESVHFAFLESGSLKRVLIIGEGVRGLLYEILKYPIEEVYYLELDPGLIDFVKSYLPFEDGEAIHDPRVKIINLEARVFLNNYKGEDFDVILLNTPPPYTAYLNRFYTYEFFKRAEDILRYDGVFSFTLPSKEDYLTKELRDFNASIYHTLKGVFPNILLIPGEELRFIVSSSDDFLTYDAEILSQRLRKYNLETQFINKFYFQMKLLPWHIDYVNNILKEHRDVKLNYDFKPITYYYGVGFFSSYFRSPARIFFEYIAKVKPYVYFLIFSFIWLLTYIMKRKYILTLSTFSMGAGGMAAVLFSILGFQIVYGYVYHKIGLISASFMLGLAIGARLVSSKIDNVKNRILIYLYLGGAVYIFFIPHIFRLLDATPHSLEWVSFLIPLFMGVIVGACFPIVNRLYLKERGRLIENVGLFYLFDLGGGAFSCLFLSMIFIPLYGLFVSSGIISFMVFLSLFFLFFYTRTQ